MGDWVFVSNSIAAKGGGWEGPRAASICDCMLGSLLAIR